MTMLHTFTKRSIVPLTKSLRFYTSTSANLPQKGSATAYLDYETAASWGKGITLLTLDRPEAKNAINRKMLDELAINIEAVRDDNVTRTLILNSSVPGVFCAGADLKERLGMDYDAFYLWHSKLGRTLRALEQLPFPVIAAMDGLALGGGLELALTADVRVAGPKASKLGLPEVRHAIMPGAGATQRLSRLIGTSRAKQLILTGRIFDRQFAYDRGVIDELAESTDKPEEAGLQGARALAAEMAQAGPLALRAAKRAIDIGYQSDIATGLEWEKTVYHTLFNTSDRQEGLQAFKEKRKPVYQGR